MLCRRTAKPAWWRRKVVLCSAALVWQVSNCAGLEYREDFARPGRPATPGGGQWDYRCELSPVTGWKEIVPGDGYAYLSAEREFLKRGRRPWKFWPFQTLSFGPVSAGTRLSMRAKNTAIPGLAAMIFVYREQDTVDEIDLEIAARDTESKRPHHPAGPDGGWTDLRMATWIAADKNRPEPTTLVQQSARDAAGDKFSLQDGEFHVYTLEWSGTEARFLIDGVLQHAITDSVPDQPSQLIFGLRQMPWAGRADWSEPQTMTVDWVAVEDLAPD